MSIERSLNVILAISQLIGADKCRNPQFINRATMMEVLIILLNDSGLANG
jgi:hypothetical protein